MSRDLLTDRETAKILGKKINTLYRTVDFFDAHDDDEWDLVLSLIHISEPTRPLYISYAVFCLK